MLLRPDSTVADIATEAPATISVFQQHQIDFCCGGKVPLAAACEAKGLAVEAVLAELEAAVAPAGLQPDWSHATLTSLVKHIQQRYHEPLRVELPRLGAMLEKVVSRHGDHLPEVLLPLLRTYQNLSSELLEHMTKEDRVLFPFIVALEAGGPLPDTDAAEWIAAPISVMEADHAQAGADLAAMRDITGGYAPPEWACPTFRGLYYGLAQLEADMHVHVHLENNVLFPRAAQLAQAGA